MPHHGEEPVLSGEFGSGTIFFSNCHMKCVYCQNYTFSQLGSGKEISDQRLAQMMLDLQAMKCHNINLVSPTHYLPQILNALYLAKDKGLAIPIVYNTGGYECIDTLRLLDSVIDIYLVDMRYADSQVAKRYSSVENYAEINQMAVLEMYRQVGRLTEAGTKGLIIRHLVLPNGLAGTEQIAQFIARNISKDAFISLMSQYHPTYKSADYPLINRRITSKEYQKAVDAVLDKGLKNGWIQPDISEDITNRFIGTNFKSNV
jgi:putative pyruvate formate lyase activating enzyme